jgi:hypothetical protein
VTYSGDQQDTMPRLRMADFPREQTYIPRIEHGPVFDLVTSGWKLDSEWLYQKRSANLWRRVNKLLRSNGIPTTMHPFPSTGRIRK